MGLGGPSHYEISCDGISSWVDFSYHQLLRRRVLAVKGSSEDFYARMMCAYYQNEPAKLGAVLLDLKSHKHFPDQNLLELVCEFRAGMLDISITKDMANQLILLAEGASWSGDVYFCAALGMYKISDFKFAKELFVNAYRDLKFQGANKKALLAKQNAITMQGNIDPTNRHIRDYFSLINEAKGFEAADVIANAYLNIADEFYKMGAINCAYKNIEESLNSLKGHSYTHQENEALLLKAEILAAMDRKGEAKSLLNELERDSNEEVIQGVKVILLRHFDGSQDGIEQAKLSPPWKAKLDGYRNISKMGTLEDRALEVLAKSPMGLMELAGIIYPGVDEGDAQNRTTTLLTRINKKVKELVLFDAKKKIYKISHNEQINFEDEDERA